MIRRALFILIPVAVLATWAFLQRTAPPEVPFAHVTRDTIESNLKTNGKVEPIEWASVRAERDGSVVRTLVNRGDTVKRGQLLVQLDTADARNQYSGAAAKVSQANAELQGLNAGGRSADLAEIENGLAKAREDLAIAQRDYGVTQRLVERNAATRQELNAAKENVDRANLQIQSLERRRASLVSRTDKTAAAARVQSAQSDAAEASRQIALGQIRSPMDGIVYQFDLKPGAYLGPGDLIASVGKLNQLRVSVYVDEPELGRVQRGMPVTIRWGALPDRRWNGTVDRLPTEIITLGTRHVGEVSCVIDNPDGTLLPGTNVDAEIHSSVVKNALTIPKEAIRREGAQTGVFKLAKDRVVWQPVKTGVASITRIQVLDGVTENDAVALPTDKPIRPGDDVKPIFR